MSITLVTEQRVAGGADNINADDKTVSNRTAASGLAAGRGGHHE